MIDSDDIEELYEWVNSLYEKYSKGEITEDEYMKAYNHYTTRKEELEQSSKDEAVVEDTPKPQDIAPEKVRSTSIAGLRKKLMEEMKK